MGKGLKAQKRRKLWLQAIRRENFVPKAHSKVCGRHFVSGFQINDPSSIDYVPTLHRGYEKSVKMRVTSTSKKASYCTTSEIVASLGEDGRRKLCGLAAPDIGAEITVGGEPHNLAVSLENDNKIPHGSDHSYSRPAKKINIKCTASQTTDCNIEKEREELKKKIKELSEINQLQLNILKKKDEELEDMHSRSAHFHPDKILDSDEAVQFYTGLRDRATYDLFLSYIQKKTHKLLFWSGQKTDYEKSRSIPHPRRLSIEAQFLATLMRLKVGLYAHDLAARIGISPSQFSRMFRTWVRFLRLELEESHRFPSREEVKHFMPPDCVKYTNLRAIIDCTEFFIETPSSLTAQRETWSAYKSHNTLKVLVACTPDGTLSCISRVYGGAASDRFVTTGSGFLEQLEPGDSIMADKGFNIDDLVRQKQAFVNLPPFRIPGQPQLAKDKVEQTRSIAQARIRVECLIGRIKNYHILSGTLPLTLYSIAEDIIHTCAHLTKLQSPVSAQVFDFLFSELH